MGMQQASRWCRSCDSQVRAQRPGANHILHLLLSLITAGLWIPIWVLSCVRFGGWRCVFCGGRV